MSVKDKPVEKAVDATGAANDVEVVKITGPQGEWTIAFCTEESDGSGQGWVKKESQEKLDKTLDAVLGGKGKRTEHGAGSLEPRARSQRSEVRGQTTAKR